MYWVISVIVYSLPGNTKNRESTRSWTARVRWVGNIRLFRVKFSQKEKCSSGILSRLMAHPHIYIMSRILVSHVTYGWVKWDIDICLACIEPSPQLMAHPHTCQVAYMNEACLTCEWVMSHVWMSHVTRTNESCHTYVFPPIQTSCHMGMRWLRLVQSLIVGLLYRVSSLL